MGLIDVTPRIDTRRLTLRAPRWDDCARIAELAGDYDICKQTLRMPWPYALKDAQDFVTRVAAQDHRRDRTFLIESERDGPVGMIGFFSDADPYPELGYWIGKPFWGRGFATEAANAALRWAARDWKKRAVTAGHFVDNPVSGTVLTKAGFLYTGEVRRQFSRARRAEADVRMMIWLP